VTGARSLTSNKTMAELDVTSPTTGPTVAAIKIKFAIE